MAPANRTAPSLEPATLAELRASLGAGRVLVERDDVARYGEPWRGPAGVPAAVLRPRDLDEVRTAVLAARSTPFQLLAQGAATGLVGASTPPPDPDRADRPTVVLSTERLRHRIEVDPVGSTAVVGAGVRLSELNDAAALHGLTLPIDLGADPSIGGMVATNTGGSRMLVHGDVRRHVLGVRAVTADSAASVVDELSVLRKHNVGPSISQLLVGAGGALGVITDVAVELTPLPAHRATAWLSFGAPGGDPNHAAVHALAALGALGSELHGTLSAFEVLSPEAVDAARHHGPSVIDPFRDAPAPPLAALVELSGSADVDDQLVAALARLDADGLLGDALVLPAADAWSMRHGVTEGLRATGTVVGFDVSVPRGALGALRAAARDAVAAVVPDATVADFGHWGDGGVHINVVLAPADTVDEALHDALADAVFGVVVDRFGGSFSAEHGIGPHNARWWTRAIDPGVRTAVRAVRSALDPLGVLGHPGLPF